MYRDIFSRHFPSPAACRTVPQVKYYFAIIPRLHSQFSEQVYRLLHADCACLGRGLVQGRRPVRPRRGRGPRGRLRRGQEGLDSVASNLLFCVHFIK